MKKLVVPDDLPGWFSLENYQTAAHMPLELWVGALNGRAFLNSLLSYARDKGAISDAEIEQLFAEGIDFLTAPCQLVRTVPKGQRLERAVELLRVGDLSQLWGSVTRQEEGLALKGYLDSRVMPDGENDQVRLAEFEQMPVDFTILQNDEHADRLINASLKVSLAVPDEVLFEDFKTCIAELRAQLDTDPIGRKINQKEIDRWCQFQILPYLDLKNWCLYKDLSVTDHAIGELLFPDDVEIDVTERVRKTIKPLADKLLRREFIEAIRAQAHQDFNIRHDFQRFETTRNKKTKK